MSKLKVFLIAGEVSGDYCGSLLLSRLRKSCKGDLEIQGVGGEYLKSAGMDSIFPISEISVMGFVEVVPKMFKISKLIKRTAEEIQKFSPDIVITIDSPGFCFRVVNKVVALRNQGTKFVHYVSPSVWAYKKARAIKMARYYDLVLALLPFEPQYYKDTGLRCEYVGHHLVESNWDKYDGKDFRKRNNIAKDSRLVGIYAGSRKTEVSKMLPIFVEALEQFVEMYPDIVAVFPAVSEDIKKIIEGHLEDKGIKYKAVIVSDEKEKIDMMKSFHCALVKSGTSSLEMTFAKIPMAVAYKMNVVSYSIATRILKVARNIKYVSITNLVLNREVIPEYIQSECTAENLSRALQKLMDPSFRSVQLEGYEEALGVLCGEGVVKPSEKAADEIIKLQN